MGKDLGRCAGHDGSPLFHDDQAVNVGGDLLHRVADHHNSRLLRGLIIADIFENALAACGVKSRRRLVENEHVRLHGDHARDGCAALLSAGQIERGFGKLRLGNADKASRTADTRVDLVFGKAHVFRAEGDIGVDSFLKQLIFRVLEHQTDAEADLAGELGVLPDVAAVKQHMAGRRLQKAVHMLHQRGFAGAGMADEADELTPADRQIDVRKRRVFKRRIRAVDMGKLLYL